MNGVSETVTKCGGGEKMKEKREKERRERGTTEGCEIEGGSRRKERLRTIKDS